MASIVGKLKELDSWVRNRLRYCIWHNWKKPKRKRQNLIGLGIDHRHAYMFSRQSQIPVPSGVAKLFSKLYITIFPKMGEVTKRPVLN